MILYLPDNMVVSLDPELESKRYRLFQPLLRDYGHMRKAAPFNDHFSRMNPLDQCYDNAIKMARYFGVIYCEGVVVIEHDGFHYSLAHGWCASSTDGAIIDPTLSNVQHRSELTYYGLGIRLDYADAWKKKAGYYGCLDGYPDGRKEGIHYDSAALWHHPIPTPTLFGYGVRRGSNEVSA